MFLSNRLPASNEQHRPVAGAERKRTQVVSVARCFHLFSLILTSASLAVAELSSNDAQAVTQQPEQQVARQLISGSTGGLSVNLNAILEHQEALAKECAQYHRVSSRQSKILNKLAGNEQDGGEEVFHWQNPVPVQVPAICLFGFSQFSHLSSWKGNDEGSRKLELVNWYYEKDDGDDDDEFITANHSVKNKTKRHAHSLANPEDAEFNESPLVEGGRYMFNPNAKQAFDENEIETEVKSKFHKDVEQILADEKWQEMMKAENKLGRFVSHLSPVVLVPGLLGSRLQARTADKKRRLNVFCSKKKMDWHDMWLSLRQLLPLAVDCWLDNVRLDYDPSTGYSKQPVGVEVRVPDFGSVESVRYLDLRQPKATGYFSHLIERYEQLGYEADKNLLAAPYDFRLAPQELTGYFSDLKHMIEGASGSSGKKVTLVCHSMGCTHLLIFFRLQSAAWRQKYIRKMIALSSPWGGATKALKALVVGDQLDLPLVSESKMRKLARTYPSIPFLLPQAEVYERNNKNRAEDIGGPILVQTPEKVYRAAQMGELLRDLNLTHQLEWFKQTSSLIKPLEPLPDLRVDCIHSLNAPTPETMIFRNQKDFPNGSYELIKGDGDGTVNLESLMVCELWASLFPNKVKHKIIMNTNHVGVLSHKLTLTHITDDVLVN